MNCDAMKLLQMVAVMTCVRDAAAIVVPPLLWLGLVLGGLPVATGQDFGFGLGKRVPPSERVKLSAQVKPVSGTRQGVLEVTANIAPAHHVYSMSQIAPGKPSVIKIEGDGNYRLLGPFVTDKEPKVKDPDPDLGYRTEALSGRVTWRAPVEAAEGVDFAKSPMVVVYSGLVCETSGSCIPISNVKATVSVGDSLAAMDPALSLAEEIEDGPPMPEDPFVGMPADSTPNQGTQPPKPLSNETVIDDGFVKLTGQINQSRLRPGDKGQIVLTAELTPGHHTYPNLPADQSADGPYMPTYIGVLGVVPNSAPTADWGIGTVTADQVPHDYFSEGAVEPIPALDGTVRWTIDFQVPADWAAGDYVMTGVMQIQTCDEFSCQPPIYLAWQVPVTVASTGSPESAGSESASAVLKRIGQSAQKLLTDSAAADAFLTSVTGVQLASRPVNTTPDSAVPTPDTASDLSDGNATAGVGAAAALDITKLKPDLKFDPQSLSVPMVVLVALFGGFILNFMPCVLPVIGLKVLSLVEQAGESRVQALKFNGVYVLGMLSVFWILALLIIFNQISGWGSQFSSTLFTIVFSGVIFAMALSYLEVWEIVLPSAVGQQSAKLEQKEGLLGTFFKGGVTTILATPCSGPGLATALAWCADKESGYVFLVFSCLGLGMGLPYLAVALYPPIISFLPKPGPWMLTFKQVMGFVLLGTVAFFLSYIELPYLFPTFCFLLVVWFACWLVGRLSFLSSTRVWLGTWVAAVLVVLFGSHVIFGWRLNEKSNEFLAEKVLSFDWNENLANDWNLYESQAYRLNTFVDRQVAYRKSLPKQDSKTLHEIDWKPFSLADLQERLHGESPETILVDFTADWCVNCKAFERTVLHSSDVEKRIRSSHVTTVIADKTHDSPEIDALLEKLTGATAIPVYAIFSKDRPFEPIVLDGTTISIANVQAALDKAGVPAASQIEELKTSETERQLTSLPQTRGQRSVPEPQGEGKESPFQ